MIPVMAAGHPYLAPPHMYHQPHHPSMHLSGAALVGHHGTQRERFPMPRVADPTISSNVHRNYGAAGGAAHLPTNPAVAAPSSPTLKRAPHGTGEEAHRLPF
mmetsp:Transcript_4925/g.14688  ORF Transcript_4925/g.14688 Transcript_4925/m.14688 type:complete len:102 (+) Transcript_4925:2-307(+)